MGAKWVGPRLDMVVKRTAKAELNRLIWAVTDIGNMVLSVGADEMVNAIETTPSSIVPGKDNRVDTGLMKDSVDVEDVHQVSSAKYEGSVGWVYLIEDYFLVQEHGGMSSGLLRGNRRITPMHALSKVYMRLQEELANELESLRA